MSGDEKLALRYDSYGGGFKITGSSPGHDHRMPFSSYRMPARGSLRGGIQLSQKTGCTRSPSLEWRVSRYHE